MLSTISPPFVGSMSYLMLFGRRGLITWRLLGLEWNTYGFHGVVSALLCAADSIAKGWNELPAGVLTVLIGGPIFCLLLWNRR